MVIGMLIATRMVPSLCT